MMAIVVFVCLVGGGLAISVLALTARMILSADWHR